ncbi:MAG: radical SAM protein [Sulfolobales archaeon]
MMMERPGGGSRVINSIGGDAYGIVRVDKPLPLIGHIAFGIIDRGTNLLQVRPYSACHLSCIFCSVDAGPNTRTRISDFIVDVDYMVEWVWYVVSHKISRKIHILIDGVGEPLLHPEIDKLIADLRESERIGVIAAETHGSVLNENMVRRLYEAGISRLNISIDSLDPEKASVLAGAEWYNIERVAEMALYANSMGIDVMITPVWIPGVNDRDIEEIVLWAKSNIKNRSSPILGIQKYVIHRRGRKIPGVAEPSWDSFYNFLETLEKRTGVKLRLSPEDLGVRPDISIPKPIRVGNKVAVKIYSKGWLKGEVIGYAKGRVVTIVGLDDINEGAEILVKIISDKDNIYLARPAQ